MANEITFVYTSGTTLTYGAYEPDGTVRVAAGTSLPEVGSTGYYTASAPTLAALDVVIIKSGSTIVAGGQYEPAVTAGVDLSTIEADLTTIDDDINSLSVDVTGLVDNGGRVLYNWTNPAKRKKTIG